MSECICVPMDILAARLVRCVLLEEDSSSLCIMEMKVAHDAMERTGLRISLSTVDLGMESMLCSQSFEE